MNAGTRERGRTHAVDYRAVANVFDQSVVRIELADDCGGENAERISNASHD